MRTIAPSGQLGSRNQVRVPFADCFITEPALQAAIEVMRSGWLTTGRQTLAFEREFAEYVGAENAVAVSSCTAAIELALRSLGLPDGAKVLVSTVTFCGAVHAIVHAGLRPVLVDVNPVSAMPDESTTRRAALAAGGVQAMLVVHWAGDPADVPALAAAAGLPLSAVVEDAAHALGTEAHTTAGIAPVGSGSGAACFSFYATKNLPIGEGGMVTTADPDRAAMIRSMRLHGMSANAWRRYQPGASWRYDVQLDGLKANMTDLQAAIGRAQLTHVEAWQRRRAQIARRYDERLAGLPGLTLPHRPAPGEGAHAWHLYAIQVGAGIAGGRDRIVDLLSERGIGTSVHFIPVHRLGYFKRYATDPGRDLAGAEALSSTLLSLPMYPRLRDDQVDAVCDALTQLCESTQPMQEIR